MVTQPTRLSDVHPVAERFDEEAGGSFENVVLRLEPGDIADGAAAIAEPAEEAWVPASAAISAFLTRCYRSMTDFPPPWNGCLQWRHPKSTRSLSTASTANRWIGSKW